MRRLLAWFPWAFLVVLACGCFGSGSLMDSLEWTTRPPERADVEGTWTAPSGVFRESADATPAPRVRLTLRDDGTAQFEGFDLLDASLPLHGAAVSALRERGAVGESSGTWDVAVAQGGYQIVRVTQAGRPVALRMWGLEPPYELTADLGADDPDAPRRLWFAREGDPQRGSAAAAPTDDPPFGMLGTVVLWIVFLILLVIVVVLAVCAALLCVVLAVCAVAVAVAVLAALAAGGAAGIAAASAVHGIAAKSAWTGFRTFATLCGAVPGAGAGLAAAWIGSRLVAAMSGARLSDAWTLPLGVVLGAAAGGLAGRIVALGFERAARALARRIGGGARTSEPSSPGRAAGDGGGTDGERP